MPPDFPPTFDGLLALCAFLRGPDGCPWDGEQTHESLKPMLLEETYELHRCHRRREKRPRTLQRNWGMSSIIVVYQIRLGSEAGEFDERDVAASV